MVKKKRDKSKRKPRPASNKPGKKLSLAMITRDEEPFLRQCLASAKPVADEIVIVDTGSTDKTIEIAKEFGAKIIEVPWTDDFSAARNVSLEAATGDWILHLDADEEIVQEDVPKLKKLLSSENPAYFLTVVNLRGEDEDHAIEQPFPSVRLFRNRPEHRFSGIIHEQVNINVEGSAIGLSSVRVRHYGYLKPVLQRREKRERNMALLEESAAKQGNNQEQRYRTANELMSSGDDAGALQLYLVLYGELLDSDRMHVPTIALNIVCCLKNLGRPDEALEWVERGLARFPDYTDLEFLRGLTHLEAGRGREALESFAACLALGEAPAIFDRQAGVGTWLAWQGTGFAFKAMGRFDVAVASFKQALSINKTDTVSLEQLGSILMAAGHEWQAVEEELSTLVDTSAPAIKDAMAALAGQASSRE